MCHALVVRPVIAILRSIVAAACLLGGAIAAEPVPADPVQFDISRQPLRNALAEFARQSDRELLFSTDIVEEKVANHVAGTYEPEDALELLLADTGLEYSVTANDTILVAEEDGGPDPGNARTRPVLMSQNQVPEERNQTSQTTNAASDTDEKERPFEEIIVTGTRIRGVQTPVGSPLQVYSEEDIRRSGASTSQQFMQTVTANFGGDAASEDLRTTGEGVSNNAAAVTVNLRGLGATSTLVLLNGRRLSQTGGFNGSFVDISNIPLSAIERVEVLTDGASAIYGSDAIAGVVNFILKRDYEGFETTLRYGDSTGDGAEEFRVGQNAGFSWSTGNAFLTYEYYRRDHLEYTDRDFSASSDLRPFGGDDFRTNFSNPATILFPAVAAVPAGQDGTGLDPSDLLLGQQNLQNENRGRDLLPRVERNNLFISARQEIASSWSLSGDLAYSHREVTTQVGGAAGFFLTVPSSNPHFVAPVPGATDVTINYNFIEDLGAVSLFGDVTGYQGTAAIDGTVGPGLGLEIVGRYMREKRVNDRSIGQADALRLSEALGFDNPATPFNPAVDGYFNAFADGSNTPANVLDYVRGKASALEHTGILRSLGATLDGALWRMGSREVGFAVGAEYREELLERHFAQYNSLLDEYVPVPSVLADDSRRVTAAYAELVIPVVDAGNARRGLRSLELSAAVRYEDYSDFGSASNPKFGLNWSPLEGAVFRASWGTSFKAPKQVDLVANAQFYSPAQLPDPEAADGMALALFLQGSNPALQPETATTWSASLQLDLPATPGLGIDLTYYDIEFEDRIGSLPLTLDLLSDPEFFAPVIIRNPDPDVVAALIASPFFTTFGGPAPDPADIDLIIDNRVRNLSRTEVDGLDLALTYDYDTAAGDWRFEIGASYMLGFDQAITAASDLVDILNTPGNPVDLKLRSGLSWTRGGLGATLFANYLDSYTDTLSMPNRKVDSWTTFDTTLSYDFGSDAHGGLGNVRASLNVLNLFDEDPPFFNGSSGAGYDQANADPLGRFIAVNLTKQW